LWRGLEEVELTKRIAIVEDEAAIRDNYAAAFRREAEAYLRRGDARQKPRVEALLAER